MSTDNEANEHLFVEVFLRAAGYSYQFRKLPPSSGPDFLLWNDESELGLEVTRVHRGPEKGPLPRRQMEGIRDSLMFLAKREWDARGLPPLEVHCHYSYHHTPLPNEVLTVARHLVDVVQAAMPDVGAVVEIDSNHHGAVSLPPAVHSLNIVRLSGHDRSYWFGGDAAWGADLTPDLVQERISAKNTKYDRYRGAGQETWLLVVMDSRRFSGMMRFGSEAAEHEYNSFFAKTFVLELLYGRFWHLRTRNPDSGSAA